MLPRKLRGLSQPVRLNVKTDDLYSPHSRHFNSLRASATSKVEDSLPPNHVEEALAKRLFQVRIDGVKAFTVMCGPPLSSDFAK